MKVSLAEAQHLKGEEQFAAYACLDTTGTLEIFNVLRPKLNANQERTYHWSLAQQSPALVMALRGCLVDTAKRDDLKRDTAAKQRALTKTLATHPLVVAVWDGKELETGWCPEGKRWTLNKGKCDGGKNHKWPEGWKALPATDVRCSRCAAHRVLPVEGAKVRHMWAKGVADVDRTCRACGAPRLRPRPFEPSSHPQVAHLLYDLCKAPPQYNRDGNLSTNDDALERIGSKRSDLLPLTDLLRDWRDTDKQLSFLKCRLSKAGRFHASFHVAGPWTGRWSSSSDAFGIGSNAQNITEQFRHIFIPDPGKKLGYADLKTAESQKVAYLSGDEAYIEAHRVGDVHTYVTRLLWPDLDWTGDLKTDKKIASSNYPLWDNVPGHDFRFQAKRIQHGSNFGLSPHGIAMIAKIPRAAAEAAQAAYFTAFPRIREWQVIQQKRVQDGLPLYNALQREVRLMGRPWDPHTWKQGLAFPPQSGIGDVLNLGLWRLWRECDPWLLELLAQVHDAVKFQFDPGHEPDVCDAVFRLMRVETPVTDIRGVTRTCVIPVELATGYNWGKAGSTNPNGLVEVKL